ncbi:asparagine synthase-related protein [bacterium]|nr:asparagine synthase-related protein [bacterium]
MIYGIVNTEKDRPVKKEDLFNLVPERLSGKSVNTFIKGNVALGVSEIDVPSIDRAVGVATSSDKKVVVAASGNIFASHTGASAASENRAANNKDVARIIWAAYEESTEIPFRGLNGQFSAAIWDSRTNRFMLVRDHLGFEPLFYHWDGQTLAFCSFLKPLIQCNRSKSNLDYRAIRNYLLFNYNPGLNTLMRDIKKVRAGYCLLLENQRLMSKRYWFLSYRNQNGRQIDDFMEELVSLTKDAIKIRTNETDSDPGAFLSGGMDSSSVVGLLSGLTDRPVHTFSFRCADKSVDESHFARVMAKHYNTRHHELQFVADELVNMEKMAAAMEEPLCDIGVELGSFILGRTAQDEVEYILTGDGGDELYAGHPVYLADKVAAKFNRIPAPLRLGVTKLAQLLPDSDKKKSLLVKSRRFAYSYGFPQKLLSNRWRIYYDDHELSDLCTPEMVEGFGELHSYDDITGLYNDADGPDLLSRSLYGDYQTLVHFHVDRLRLTRASGVEARFPLHDYRLIEFSATIPARLKIRGGSQVKYIQKRAMTGILPDEIVFRKDKMGHNVPMKSWMRETSTFRDLLNDVLSDPAIKRRGFFDAKKIQNMMDLHLRRKKDYSHRLYALVVLELWLKNHVDESH